MENSGVVEEVKNVIAIESMPIIEPECIDIESVELGIDMPDIVLDGDIDIESIELVIDMSIVYGLWKGRCNDGVL